MFFFSFSFPRCYITLVTLALILSSADHEQGLPTTCMYTIQYHQYIAQVGNQYAEYVEYNKNDNLGRGSNMLMVSAMFTV